MEQYSAAELSKYGGVVLPLFELQTVTISGNNQDDPLNILPFSRALFFLRCTAMEGGGSEELDVTIQTKDPSGDYWFNLMSFWPVLTAVGGTIKVPFMLPNLGEKLAISYDLSDITSVTFSVYGVFKVR